MSKKKTMSKLKIGYNKGAEIRDRNSALKKANVLKKAVNFFEAYHLTGDVELLHKEGFYNYFLRLYAETYANNYPIHTTPLERAEMGKVNIQELKDLDIAYKVIRTPFDPLTMEVPESTDYNYYLENEEEVEKYKQAEELCEVLNKYANHRNINFRTPLFADLFSKRFRDVELNDNNLLIPSQEPHKYKPVSRFF